MGGAERRTNLEEWLRALPWVFERTLPDAAGSVRLYGIACEHLPRHRIWAITGVADNLSPRLSLVVSLSCANSWHAAGVAEPVLSIPGDDVLVILDAANDERASEELARSAYDYGFERAGEAFSAESR